MTGDQSEQTSTQPRRVMANPAGGELSGSGSLSVGVATGSFSLIGRGVGFASAAVPLTVDALVGSARTQAARGLRAREAGDHDDAALHLGMMLEHLAKAYLVRYNPVLVLDSRYDFGSMLLLAGQGQRVKQGHTLRTVAFGEALDRIGQMLTGNAPHGDKSWTRRFGPVLAARNSAAHVGESPADPDTVAQLAITGALELIPHLGLEQDDLFGQYTRAATSLADDRASALERRVRLAIDTARSEYQRRTRDMLPSEKDAAFGHINVLATVTGHDDRQDVSCPACSRTAIVSGDVYIDTLKGGFFDPPTTDNPLYIILDTARLNCPYCSLRLRGTEELALAHIPGEYAMRPATPSDEEEYEYSYRLDFEPDDDDADDVPEP